MLGDAGSSVLSNYQGEGFSSLANSSGMLAQKTIRHSATNQTERNLRAENRDLYRQNDRLDGDKKSLARRNNRLDTENKSLSRDNVDLTRDNVELKSENTSLEQDVYDLEQLNKQNDYEAQANNSSNQKETRSETKARLANEVQAPEPSKDDNAENNQGSGLSYANNPETGGVLNEIV